VKRYLRYSILVLVLLLALPVIGCGNDAAELKDAYIKSMEVESSRNRSDLIVKINVPPEELSEEMQLLLTVLEEGLTMEMVMESLTSMKIDLQAHAGEALREKGIWPYQESLAAEVFVQDGKTAFKTSADPVYLLIDPADAALLAPENGLEMEGLFDEVYSRQQVELMMEFMVPFIEEEFNFRFSQVEDLGTVELEMPDETIEVRGIRLQLEHDEIMELIAYTCRQLAESEYLKNYIEATVLMPLERMEEEGLLPEEELPTPEQKEEIVEMTYGQFRSILLQVAEVAESPILQQREFGLELSGVEEYYLDEEGHIRKTVSSYRISAEHEAITDILGTPMLDVEIESQSITWDINQPLAVDFPAAGETVSMFALVADPELAAELGDGPLYSLYQFFSTIMPPPEPPVGPHLYVNVEEEQFMLDGEPVEMDVVPYLDEGVLMLPLRQLAELAGAEVSWDAETREIYYRDAQRQMKFTAGSDLLLVNGEEISLERPVVIEEGRSMVPLGVLELFVHHLTVHDGAAFIVF